MTYDSRVHVLQYALGVASWKIFDRKRLSYEEKVAEKSVPSTTRNTKHVGSSNGLSLTCRVNVGQNRAVRN